MDQSIQDSTWKLHASKCTDICFMHYSSNNI